MIIFGWKFFYSFVIQILKWHKEDIFNTTDKNYKSFQTEGKITQLGVGQCKTAAVLKEDIHKYLIFSVNNLQ